MKIENTGKCAETVGVQADPHEAPGGAGGRWRGEDCAVMKLAEDEVFVLSTDPITGNGQGYGRAGGTCDGQRSGQCRAEPVGMLLTGVLPESVEEADIRNMMEEVENACHQLNIQVMGGHTEVTRR